MALSAGRATIGLLLVGRADVNSMVRGIYMINGSLATTDKALGRTNRAAMLASKAWMAVKVGAVAAAIGFAAIVKVMADVEQEVQRVYAMTKGGTKELILYTDAAYRSAIKYKGGATDMAQALWWVASAGYKGAEAVKVMNAAMALATATSAEAERASEVLMGQLFAFGGSAKDAAHFADVMTKTINLSLLSMDDLGTALQYVAPQAHNLGWSFEELNAAIAVLRDNGITASRVGTGLRGVLVQLMNPSQKVREEFDKLGISEKVIAKYLNDPIRLFGYLASKGMTTAQAFKIFGRWAGTAGVALMKGVPKLKEYQKALGNVGGEAERTAKIQLNTLWGKLENVRDSFFAITELFWRGQGVMSGLRGEIGKLGVSMGKLYDAMWQENKWAGIVETLEKRIKHFARVGRGDIGKAKQSLAKAQDELDKWAGAREKAWTGVGEAIGHAITRGITALMGSKDFKRATLEIGLAIGKGIVQFFTSKEARDMIGAGISNAVMGAMSENQFLGMSIPPPALALMGYNYGRSQLGAGGPGSAVNKGVAGKAAASAAKVVADEMGTKLAKKMRTSGVRTANAWAAAIRSRKATMLKPVKETVDAIEATIRRLDSILGGGTTRASTGRSAIGTGLARRGAYQPGDGDGAGDDWANKVASRYGFGANITPEKVLAAANAVGRAIGKPYVIGASGPNSFDCSGFVSWVLNQAGVANGRWTSGTFPSILSPGVGPLTVWGKPPTTGPYGHAWMSFWNRYFFESTRPSVHRMGGNRGDWTYHGIPSLGGGGRVEKTGVAVVHKNEHIGMPGPITINVYGDGADEDEIAYKVASKLQRLLGSGVRKVAVSRV